MASATAWLAAMATIQAMAALLLVWMARSTAAAAQSQAVAATTQANVARVAFLVEFMGQLIAAAEELRVDAYNQGLDREALELERTITAWFDMGLSPDERSVEKLLQRLVAANHVAFKAIRDAEHAERNRIGEDGGVTT